MPVQCSCSPNNPARIRYGAISRYIGIGGLSDARLARQGRGNGPRGSTKASFMFRRHVLQFPPATRACCLSLLVKASASSGMWSLYPVSISTTFFDHHRSCRFRQNIMSLVGVSAIERSQQPQQLSATCVPRKVQEILGRLGQLLSPWPPRPPEDLDRY
jgi:hypothetical protein